MRRALITGITGQDGSYLAEELAAQGWSVHGLIRAGSTVPPGLAGSANVHLQVCELTDLDGVRQAVDIAAPDQVFHLAGMSSVWRSWEQPVVAAQVNGVAGTCLLEATLRYQDAAGKPVAFVNASSAEIFAGSPQMPQTEATALRPTSPYGATKAYTHQLTQIFRTRGLKASNAVLYNHESPRRPNTFVTRKITEAVARIAVTGGGMLTLGTLESRRDWGWAPDYVQAMMLMAEHPEADDFVIATGRHHSVGDFVRFAFEAAEVDGWEQYLHTDAELARVGDSRIQVGDPTHAREKLGWTPTLDLPEIVRRMVAHDLEQCAARV